MNNNWIDFLSGCKVIKVTNEKEFEVFRKFMEECGLLYTLKDTTTFKDWQYIAKINGYDENVFLFEYSNYKGLTWSDNIKESIKWYGDKPIEISELNEFFNRKELDIKKQIEYLKLREERKNMLSQLKNSEGVEL